MCALILILPIKSLWATNGFDIRFELDDNSCLPSTVCYDVQIRSSNNQGWNLATQNYRVFFDGAKAWFNKELSYSLLPEDKYSAFILRDVIENVDASFLSTDLLFSDNLSFINFSIDLMNVANGGMFLPSNQQWLSTAKLCFDYTEEALERSVSCMNMVWGRKELTESYAPAYVLIGEWLDSYVVQDTKGNVYSDLDILNGCVATEIISIMEHNIPCYGDPFGSIEIINNGTNPPYSVKLNGETADINKLIPGVYEVKIVDNSGCEFSHEFEIYEPEQLNINIDSLVAPRSSESSDGLIRVSVSGGTPPYSFEWFKHDTVVSTEQNMNAAHAGSYELWITDSNGCSVSSQVIQMDAKTSINDPGLFDDLLIYPNPAGRETTVRGLSSSFDIVHVDLIDVLGRSHQVQYNIAEDHIVIFLDNFPPGLFVLRLGLTENKTITKWLVKM